MLLRERLPSERQIILRPQHGRQRLDAQEDFAELAGAAGLLLVPVVAFGEGGDRFAVGDARRAGVHFHAVAFAHALQHHLQMQVRQPAHHHLVELLVVLDAKAGIFLGQSRLLTHEALLASFALVSILALAVYLLQGRKIFFLIIYVGF